MRDKLSQVKDIVAIVANELERLNVEKRIDDDSIYDLVNKLDNAYVLVEELESFLDDLVYKL